MMTDEERAREFLSNQTFVADGSSTQRSVQALAAILFEVRANQREIDAGIVEQRMPLVQCMDLAPVRAALGGVAAAIRKGVTDDQS